MLLYNMKEDHIYYDISLNSVNNAPLSAKLHESGYKIEYNHNLMQNEVDGIHTCGRHCRLLMLLKDIQLPKYIELISGVPDTN